MRLNKDDQALLQELCSEHKVDFDKIMKLLNTEQDYELKERRSGIYDALEEIIKQSGDVK